MRVPPPSGRTRGEGGEAKGDQTVVAVVFLAVVLVEDRRAETPPALLWPGKSNAKSAIKRPRIGYVLFGAGFYAVSPKSQSRRLYNKGLAK